MQVWVECYAGHRADQYPVRFFLDGCQYEVVQVADQWYSPDALYFRVRADDGNLYVLRRQGTSEPGVWTLEAFRQSTGTG